MMLLVTLAAAFSSSYQPSFFASTSFDIVPAPPAPPGGCTWPPLQAEDYATIIRSPSNIIRAVSANPELQRHFGPLTRQDLREIYERLRVYEKDNGAICIMAIGERDEMEKLKLLAKSLLESFLDCTKVQVENTQHECGFLDPFDY